MTDLLRPAPPARATQRDWFVPAVIAGSLFVHGAIVASLIWSPRAQAARPPLETPVEIVQQMPEPPKPPPKASEPTKQAAPAPKQAKTDAPKQAKAEPPKQAKTDVPKQAKAEPPKPVKSEPQKQAKSEPPPKQPAARHAPQKTAASKPAAAKTAFQKTAAREEPPPAQQDVAKRMQELIGPMAAYALPALGTGDSALDDGVSYKQIVLSRVAAQKREGRHEGVPGHVIVAFAIGDHGEVLRCNVLEKSADPNLDAEALAMVQRAAPYPPPPPGAPREFTFGLRFQIL